MKYSFNWLKELSDTKLSPEKVVENLTMRAFEVEGLEKSGEIPESVVVGEILEIKKHPNADKLQLVRVDIEKEILDIVCGAHNIKTGDKVPVALIGTKLIGVEIKEASIRGEKSCGMLCALDELGLGADHSGIIILDQSAKIGEKAKKYLTQDDSILEIKVLPDRAHDALSYVGVAREIAALEGRKIEYDFEGLKLPKSKSKKLKVKIEDKKACPRYIGAVLENVQIKNSPEWLQEKLRASGVRPINNVVDATNFIMLELGNPIHAFDAEKIGGQDAKIIIRRAKKGENLTLLDGTIKKLEEGDLVITSEEKAIALAGIMGGENSGISENTKNIIIEVANFEPTMIRKTRTRLGIKTEASDRFEKGLDPNLAEKAAVRILEIIQNTAGGNLEGIVDEYPSAIKSWKVKLNLSYVDKLLGEKISAKDIIKILRVLEIETKNKKDNLECLIPTYRVDLKTQEDLIEEIGRVNGYGKITPEAIVSKLRPSRLTPEKTLERKARNILTGLGFDEVYNYSFYSEESAKNLGLEKSHHYALQNPTNPDQELVRTALIPNILKNVGLNLRNFSEFNIFEIGKVYFVSSEKVVEKNNLALAIALEDDRNGFRKAKGYAETFFGSLGIKDMEIEPISLAFLDNNRSFGIKMGGKRMGYFGKVASKTLENFGTKRFKGEVFVLEIDLKNLLENSSALTIFESLPKFPEVLRDISLLVPSQITAKQIEKEIKSAAGEILKSIIIFDVFEKDTNRSLAYHLKFYSKDRTLESREVDLVMEKIIRNLEKLGIEIRK